MAYAHLLVKDFMNGFLNTRLISCAFKRQNLKRTSCFLKKFITLVIIFVIIMTRKKKGIAVSPFMQNINLNASLKGLDMTIVIMRVDIFNLITLSYQ